MSPERRRDLLHIAEIIDSYRIYPRFVIVPAVGFWIWKICWTLIQWYIHQPPEARGTQESAVLTGTIAAMVPLITLVINTYSKTGRDWSQQAPTTVASTSTQTTVTQQ